MKYRGSRTRTGFSHRLAMTMFMLGEPPPNQSSDSITTQGISSSQNSGLCMLVNVALRCRQDHSLNWTCVTKS